MQKPVARNEKPVPRNGKMSKLGVGTARFRHVDELIKGNHPDTCFGILPLRGTGFSLRATGFCLGTPQTGAGLGGPGLHPTALLGSAVLTGGRITRITMLTSSTQAGNSSWNHLCSPAATSSVSATR